MIRPPAAVVPLILFTVLIAPSPADAQLRVAAEPGSVCAPESGTRRLEAAAPLPRRPTTRQVRELRFRLSRLADAAVEKLTTGRADRLPEERFTLASSRFCVSAHRRFENALITEFSFPKLDAAQIAELESGLKKALEPTIDQFADAHAPEEGQVCYFSPTLGIWICIDIFIDIDIDL